MGYRMDILRFKFEFWPCYVNSGWAGGSSLDSTKIHMLKKGLNKTEEQKYGSIEVFIEPKLIQRNKNRKNI